MTFVLYNQVAVMAAHSWWCLDVRPKMAAKFFPYISIQCMWVWKNPRVAIFVRTLYEKVVGNRPETKMAAEHFLCMPIQCTWVWETSLSRNFCMGYLWKSCWQSPEDQNVGRIFPVYAYRAHLSVGNTLKSRFLYGLCMRKLLIIGQRPKWRPSLFRTRLYSVRECRKHR